MAEQEDGAAATIIGNLAGLPNPVRMGLFAVASRMLGGLAAFPTAWLRRPVQNFEDTTDARTVVARGLAEALVQDAKNNPDIMKAVAEAYLPTNIRKMANRIAITRISAEEIHRDSGSGEQAAAPDEDWFNAFMRYSEDASSNRLQGLFGKILAGEIVNPGSFSPATLRAVSELNQSTAEDFSWAWAMNIDEEMPKTSDMERGENWTRLTRLREIGLISPIPAAVYSPEWDSAPGRLGLWRVGGTRDYIHIFMESKVKSSIEICKFTRVGMEMGRLLPQPNFENNLRAVAQRFPKENLFKIEITIDANFKEIIWDRNFTTN